MEEIIDTIIRDFEQLKTNNLNQVEVDKVLTYLHSIKSDPQHSAQFRTTLAVRTQRVFNETQLEMFRSVIKYGESSLKAGLLINGMGAISLLGFLGTIVEKLNISINGLIVGIISFTIGALLVVLANFLTYFSQGQYFRAIEYRLKSPTLSDQFQRQGDGYRLAVCIFGWIALACIIVACLSVAITLWNATLRDTDPIPSQCSPAIESNTRTIHINNYLHSPPHSNLKNPRIG